MKNTIIITMILGLFQTGVHAQWVQTSGPGGDLVHCLAMSGSLLFAGTDENGIFMSTNNGTAWTNVSTGLPQSQVLSLTAYDTNLFAGTSNSGVYRSTNNGASWTAAGAGMSNWIIRGLASLPNGSGGSNLFAGTFGGGVDMSTDNGTSWTTASSGLTSLFVNVILASGTNLIAGTYGGGVFLSTNS